MMSSDTLALNTLISTSSDTGLRPGACHLVVMAVAVADNTLASSVPTGERQESREFFYQKIKALQNMLPS